MSAPAGGGQPDKQGYLKKIGAFNKSVRRRWFQLNSSSPPFFSYYTFEGGAHIRTVRIEGADNHVIVNAKEKNSFKIICGNRTWAFYAESGAEMASWVHHFTLACEEASRAQVDKKGGQTSTSRVLVAGQYSHSCAATVLALLKNSPHCEVRAFVQLHPNIESCLSDNTKLETLFLDCDDENALDEAFEDVDTLVVEFPQKRLLETALAYISAAKRARLKLLCVLAPPVSPATAILATQFLHIERDLKQSNLKYCIVRTNLLLDVQLKLMPPENSDEAERAFSSYFAPDEKISFVSSLDVGVFAATVAAVEPWKHAGRYYYITGNEAVSPTQIASAYAELLSEPVRLTQLDTESYINQLVGEGHSRWTAEANVELADQNRRAQADAKRREKAKPGGQDRARAQASETMLGMSDLGVVSPDFEAVTTSEQSSMREFIQLMVHAMHRQSDTDVKSDSDVFYPILEAEEAKSMLPPRPEFAPFLDELADHAEEMKSAVDKIGVPTISTVEDDVVVYNVRLGPADGKNTVIQKRFSDFVNLHKKLKTRFPDMVFTPLPGRTLFFNADKQQVEERRAAFNQFLQELVVVPSGMAELTAFLDVDVPAVIYSRSATRQSRVRVITRSASSPRGPTSQSQTNPTPVAI